MADISTTSSPTFVSSPAGLKSPTVTIDPAAFFGNRTNSVVSLEDPVNKDYHWSGFYKESEDVFGEFYTFELQQKQAAAAISSSTNTVGHSTATAVDKHISQTGVQLAAAMNLALTIPKGVTIPPPTIGGPGGRQASARQLSGQLDEEVARSWEEDWEDEDTEDAFDVIMGKISAGANRQE